MAYKPTNTHYGIAAVIIIAIILLAGWKYWGWFGSSATSHKDGEACTTSAGTAGVYKGGICTDSGGAPGNPNSTVRTVYIPENPLHLIK